MAVCKEKEYDQGSLETCHADGRLRNIFKDTVLEKRKAGEQPTAPAKKRKQVDLAVNMEGRQVTKASTPDDCIETRNIHIL